MAAGPSIYDIARLAGISAGSVSKILNNKGHFSDATRKRVRDIAVQQGYVANFAAKSLRELRSRSVGIITPDVSNEFFSSIVLDAEIALREHGYTSYICNFSNEVSVEEACVRGLRHKQVDAFLFVGGSGAVSRELVGESTPVACVDRIGCGGLCVEVGNDARAMAYDATRTLVAHGCRRIVYLSVFRGLSQLARGGRFASYCQALEEAGLAVDESLVVEGPHHKRSYVEAEEIVCALLDGGRGFDGIVAVGDRIAVGALNALRRRGVAVGSDVRVIGMDNMLYTRIMSPTISTIDRHTDVLAQDSAMALFAMLEGERPAGDKVVVPHRVIERETTLGLQG